jgi:sterol desaturase/sphingolipid hydroxylase (fatty acid hydroxylase superfamily)
MGIKRVVRGLLLLGLAGGLLLAERRRPLRRWVEPGPERLVRNTIVGGLSAVVTTLTETAWVMPLARQVERRRIGLVHWLGLGPRLRFVVGLLLLDYTLFVWHWLNHRVPALWRFHLVHHVDLDLDASTGLRFHFAEMASSGVFRAAQVLAIGADRRTLAMWEKVLVASVVFHHSNLRLPLPLERAIGRVLVTPRMHGIHHSIVRSETNSNFSSLFVWWDVLHRSRRLDVPQGAITIGVPGYRDAAELTLGAVLRLPFVESSREWRLPDGTVPERELAAAANPKSESRARN